MRPYFGTYKKLILTSNLKSAAATANAWCIPLFVVDSWCVQAARSFRAANVWFRFLIRHLSSNPAVFGSNPAGFTGQTGMSRCSLQAATSLRLACLCMQWACSLLLLVPFLLIASWHAAHPIACVFCCLLDVLLSLPVWPACVQIATKAQSAAKNECSQSIHHRLRCQSPSRFFSQSAIFVAMPFLFVNEVWLVLWYFWHFHVCL